jgi:ribokinase
VAIIAVDGDGHNQISVALGANECVRHEGEHDLLLTQLETPWALPRARTVVLNPAPARAGLELAGVDVVIPNEHEARQLTGEEDPERQRARLEALGARRAIVTWGARGVYDGAWHPAFAVDVVDTVGAGDAFVGAFVAALAEEHPEPLRLAQAAAALSVGRPGAMSAPARAEVEAFLESH